MNGQRPNNKFDKIHKIVNFTDRQLMDEYIKVYIELWKQTQHFNGDVSHITYTYICKFVSTYKTLSALKSHKPLINLLLIKSIN